MDVEPAEESVPGLVAELGELAGLGLLVASPARELGRDVVVALARTGLERVLEQPAVRRPIERAARHTALRVATTLTERMAAEFLTAAEGNAVTAAALGMAGRATGHPLSRAARRLALRNPFTSNLVGLTEWAAGTGLARAAAGAALEPVADAVADLALDMVLELGPELAVEIAGETAADLAGTLRTGLAGLGSAAVELGPLPAVAVGWTGNAARSEPVRLVTRTAGEFAAAAERLGVHELAARGATEAAGWAARTELGRALTVMADEVVRAALRDLIRDIARDSVRLAWTRAVSTLLSEDPPSPSSGSA